MQRVTTTRSDSFVVNKDGQVVLRGSTDTDTTGTTGTTKKTATSTSKFSDIPIVAALEQLDAALKKTNKQLEQGTISPYVAEQRLNEFLTLRDQLIGEVQREAKVTINVNSPSIIDETGFTRAVVNAMNSVEYRQGGGASALVNL